MGVISAIWQMYFGQKQSRLIKSCKNVRKTLSAVEWLHENWMNWLLLTRILNPILMHMLGNTQNLHSTKTSNQIKICRVWKICKTKPTKPDLPNHIYLTKLNQTYKTKANNPNLPNQTKQTKFIKPNIQNQSYQTSQTNRDLFLQIYSCVIQLKLQT